MTSHNSKVRHQNHKLSKEVFGTTDLTEVVRALHPFYLSASSVYAVNNIQSLRKFATFDYSLNKDIYDKFKLTTKDLADYYLSVQ